MQGLGCQGPGCRGPGCCVTRAPCTKHLSTVVPEMVEGQSCAGVDCSVDGKQAGKGWVGQAALRLYLI